jgi:prepilin signal peptidase PulO-like enzyme (type II secretory pathway)
LLGIIPALLLFLLFLVKPNALGAGDIKLLAILGLVFGLEDTILILFVMSLSSLFYIITRTIFTRKRIVSIPLAPFITIGVVVNLSIHMLIK